MIAAGGSRGQGYPSDNVVPVGAPPPGEPRGAVWLAIDSATDAIGIAVLADALMHEAHWRTRRRHTELLTAKVAEALASCDLTVPDLVGVAVALGPGSYTGLRIGLAFAKGLALGTGLAVVGVPTLDIVAAPLSPPSVPRMATLWAVLSAGRGRIVAAPYPPLAGDWPPPSGLGVWTPDDLVAAVRPGDWVAGEMGLALVTRLEDAGCLVAPPAARVRRAGWLAELGRARVTQAQSDGLDDLVPVYASPGTAP